MTAPPPRDHDDDRERAMPPQVPTTVVPVGPEPPPGNGSQAPMPVPVTAGAPGNEPLRDLRAEIVDLQRVLDEVGKGNITLEQYAPYVETTRKDVQALIDAIGRTDDTDGVRHIRNIWEQMSSNPLLGQPAQQLDAPGQLHCLNMLDQQCREIIFQCGMITIPSRVQQWLSESAPGYYIPFHEVFDDELPVYDDRVKLLKYLKYAPMALRQEKQDGQGKSVAFVGGLVDVDTGLIYRYDSVAHQRRSLAILLGGFAAATVVVALSHYLPIGAWPAKSIAIGVLLIGWGAVLAGIIMHAAISQSKAARTQTSLPPVLAIGDLMPLIDAKLGVFLFKLLLALFGFFGLLFVTGTSSANPANVLQATMVSSFLLGYSLDSFVELFAGSIEQRSAAQLAAARRQLGVAEQ